MENKRIVDINIYWAEIIRDTAQFGQIAVAENPEFNRLSECIFKALEDSFIHSASEYGVKRWESMLQISPSQGDTLEDRKARILTYLNIKTPYTWRVLKQLIGAIVDDDRYYINYDNDAQKLYIEIIESSREKVADLVSRVVPMNLEVVYLPWRWKYEHCTSKADMEAVDPNYKSDLTKDGKWVYPLPKLTSGDQLFNGVQISAVEVNEFPLLGSGYFMFASNKAIKQFTARMPKMTWFDRTFHNSTLEVFDYDGESFSPNVIQLGFNACKNFRTFNAVFGKKISNANFAFSECILDKPSVLRIANSALPTASGNKFTIGIHVDLQNDAEVLAALDTMAANGWKMTIQWNGTPTSGVALTDLEEIYAKVEESEYGDYTDENGNRCMLDWGHQITSPDGKKPSELGYKLFFSIYDAEKYYKLTKIEGVENE